MTNANEFESIALAIAILAGDTNRVRAFIGIGVTLSNNHYWVFYEAYI